MVGKVIPRRDEDGARMFAADLRPPSANAAFQTKPDIPPSRHRNYDLYEQQKQRRTTGRVTDKRGAASVCGVTPDMSRPTSSPAPLRRSRCGAAAEAARLVALLVALNSALFDGRGVALLVVLLVSLPLSKNEKAWVAGPRG